MEGISTSYDLSLVTSKLINEQSFSKITPKVDLKGEEKLAPARSLFCEKAKDQFLNSSFSNL